MNAIRKAGRIGLALMLAALGSAFAAMLGGCAGKAPPTEQILCRFSEDSVPEFRFSELIESMYGGKG